MNLDMLRGDCFFLEVEGLSRAGFTRCDGLSARREVDAYHEGGRETPHLFPGDRLPGRLRLERGVTRDRDLWEWFERGDARRGAVVLVDGRGRERLRFSFEAGWPCRWDGPRLRADVATVALEVLEIAHEGLRCRSSRES